MSREEAMAAYITEMKLVAQKVVGSQPGGTALTLPGLPPICPLHVDTAMEGTLLQMCPPGLSALVRSYPDEGGLGGSWWKGPAPSQHAPVLQVIDTVPLGEMAEDMFGYFEPLYQVIPDMPRPPEPFLRRVTGQAPRWGVILCGREDQGRRLWVLSL